ncbi:hypothetical protein EXIGLDRAFT_846941 [Exidia glandulosa HHB12029]|uniref:Uncharacterized protein n=1 Tax=Exidia glandulosa HHB12029 TaxID=1314781 RepID=A0A166NCN7_EXIGL|nr:hypothetical protein EXIGLDRAFT_846941 [Exidia glandulosa HHB12029]
MVSTSTPRPSSTSLFIVLLPSTRGHLIHKSCVVAIVDDGGSSSPCATFLTFVDLVESINELDISLVMQFGARVRDRQSWTYASSIVYPNDVVSVDVPFALAMHAPPTRHPMRGSTSDD